MPPSKHENRRASVLNGECSAFTISNDDDEADLTPPADPQEPQIDVPLASTPRGIVRSPLNVNRDVFQSLPQFFADVKESQEQMRKMQENMKKKYSCDRATTATRLEDLLQDAAVGWPTASRLFTITLV